MVSPRFINPETGDDITADVIEELVAMAQPANPVILEREAANIARCAGNLAREFCGGHMVAQMPEEVFNYWAHRFGPEFFTKGDGVEYLTKHFPQIGCKYMPEKPTFLVQGRRDEARPAAAEPQIVTRA